MISEIKSKYILMHIYNFISDKNFPLKLLFYSKKYQNKLEINYSYCYEKYLEELHFKLNDFLYKNEDEYKKDILREEYDNFIIKNGLNKDKFEKIIYEVINNKNEKDEKYYINKST